VSQILQSLRLLQDDLWENSINQQTGNVGGIHIRRMITVGKDEAGASGVDASGNKKLCDVGPLLKDAISTRCGDSGLPVDIKYIDPSYTIRGLAANSLDSAFCLVLGQHAVHAGMAGRTNMMVGYWNSAFTHVPLPLVASGRKSLDPMGEEWQRVLDATGQPVDMVGT